MICIKLFLKKVKYQHKRSKLTLTSLTILLFTFFFLTQGCSLSGKISSFKKSQKDESFSPITSPVTGSEELKLSDPNDYIKISNQTNYPITGACRTSGSLAIEINSSVLKTGLNCLNGTFATNLDLSALPSGTVDIRVYFEANTSIESKVSVMKDTTAPILVGIINDGSTHYSLSESPSLSWPSASDAHSGVAKYQIALGTSSGGAVDFLNWTDVGLVTSYQLTSQSFTRNQVYYLSIRAIDNAGNMSVIATGDGWTPDTILNSITGLILDEAHNSLVSAPEINFSYSSAGNTVALDEFEYSIGTTSGGVDVVNWTGLGSSTSLSVTSGLNLTLNTDYFINIRAKDITGKTSSVVSGTWRAVNTVTVSPRYPTASNWNEYVRSSATTTICDGTEASYYACLHGGEKKTVSITGENSCTNLEVNDSQDAFKWHCKPGTPVSFVTYELKDGRGLKDLVNATSWKENRIIVKKSGIPIAASTKATWWTNTVTDLPDNSSGAAISLSANTIYTVSSNKISDGYDLGNGSAVVTLGTAVLAARDINSTILKGQLFGGIGYMLNNAWIEGRVFGAIGNGSYDYFTLVVANNLYHDGVFGWDSYPSQMLFRNYHSHSSNYMKFTKSVFRNSSFKKNLTAPNPTGHQNVLLGNYFFEDSGVIGNNNKFVSNFYFDNLNLNFSQRSTILNTLTYRGSVTIGSSSNITLAQFLGANFSPTTNSATSFKISGLVGFNNCTVYFASGSGINSSCVLASPSNGTLISGLDAFTTAPSFVGVVSSDSHHPSYTGAAVNYADITNFLEFDRPSRRWVNSANTTQRCNTGMTCVIYDMAIKSTDTKILNKSDTLSAANSSFPSVSTDNCPAEVHGNVTIVNQSSTPETFLKNAIEILGDQTGDEDGLCESSEDCIYTPNIGPYQGHGDYYTKTCAFQNGTITNVKMYAYPQNGY